jgi:hypothetical protein
LCCWNAIGVELAGDLTQAPAGDVRGLDSFHYLFGDLPRAASERRCGTRLGGLSTFGEESFKLVDRDQSCAPGHLDRVHVRENSPDEGGAADAERFGSLATRVGESLDARRLPDDWLERRGRW